MFSSQPSGDTAVSGLLGLNSEVRLTLDQWTKYSPNSGNFSPNISCIILLVVFEFLRYFQKSSEIFTNQRVVSRSLLIICILKINTYVSIKYKF